MKDINQFLDEIKNNEDLRNELSKYTDNDKLNEWLKENGYDFDASDLEKYSQNLTGELSEEELDMVSGGTDTSVYVSEGVTMIAASVVVGLVACTLTNY